MLLNGDVEDLRALDIDPLTKDFLLCLDEQRSKIVIMEQDMPAIFKDGTSIVVSLKKDFVRNDFRLYLYFLTLKQFQYKNNISVVVSRRRS